MIRRGAVLAVVVVLGVALGVAAAYGVSTREKARYRAEASLVVERGTQPLTGGAASHGLVLTIRDLARSETVSQAVITNLALKESTAAFRSRVHISVEEDSAVLLIRADAPERIRAESIAVQLGLVVTQTVHERFGQAAVGGEPVQVAVLDPAHALPDKVSPNLRRNVGWGALFGLVAGLLVANILAARRPPRLAVEPPPVLGKIGPDGGFDEVAARLVELAKQRPFQTVVVTGDADAHVAIGVAQALNDRGEATAWARADDTDAAGIEALAAQNAFVLVAASELGGELASQADAVVATTDGSTLPLELVLGLRGVRLLGAIVIASEREET